MNEHSGAISADKPKSIFNKNVRFDVKSVFSGLTKGLTHAASGSISELGGDAAEVLAGLGLETTTSETAYLLIKRALFAAAFDLARESISHFQCLSADTQPKLSSSLSTKLENLTILLDSNFLSNPRSLPLLHEIVPLFEQWLIDMGISPHSARLISSRYDSYFVYALSSEWRKNHAAYKDLIDALHTPFGIAEDRERDWENYFAMLNRRTNENIFDEPFSLSQIYVPLNAYYIEKKPKSKDGESSFLQKKRRHVVNLEKNLTEWLTKRSKEDAVRVVSGGPGSGKSSFMKMLCVKICEKRLARPIYIPLHLIDPTRDVTDEISRFVRDEGFLRFNPLDPESQVKDLVLIFDGLDELASQGKVAAQVAKDFIQAVERMVERRNLGNNSILVLLSGRELVVQENETEFRRNKQVLNVLPYFVPENERDEYDDPSSLLTEDLRNTWWRNYGSLIEKSFDGIPQNLRKHGIDEITAQPLLNYLVALSFSRGRLNFEKSLNLNSVYADLVTAVYERGYEKNRIHKPINHIRQKDFVRVLEEIGLAAWHGSDGRSTSVNEILAHCKESGLESLLTTFQEGAKAGVTKLLAAFFFRQNGQQASGDATFVFTHKSFGEYLTAVRIVRGIERIVIQLQRRIDNPDDGYDITEGLVHWIKLVGPAQMTVYIRRFFLQEVSQRSKNDLKQWKDRLSDLLLQAIEKHMPMDKLGGLTFAEAYRQNNNSAECLVIAVNACAIVLNDPITLRLSSQNTFGTFLRRIAPQRVGPQSPILFDALSHFDLSGQFLDMADLYGANLSFTNWTGAAMHYANLAMANLTDAILDEAHMSEINLTGAQLSRAKLRHAKMLGAKLENANFSDADLSHSNISDATVHMANFQNAIVNGMEAKNVDFNNTREPPVSWDALNNSMENSNSDVHRPSLAKMRRSKG